MKFLAKVLITSIGTGIDLKARNYKNIKYSFQDSQTVYETPLIADALSQHLKVDKIFMIGTNKSMWEEVYNYFSHPNQISVKEDPAVTIYEKIGEENEQSALKEEDLTQVRKALDDYLQRINPEASGGSLCKLIFYGKNNYEIINNFNIIMDLQNEIHPGDKIYLDITHAFRSIPLFLYLMIDFIQTLRKEDAIHLSGIFYGMVDEGKKSASIVDLNPLFQITQWTKGIYEFTNYGNVDLMVQLLEDGPLKDSMKKISDLSNLNFIKELQKQVDRLRSLIEDYNQFPSEVFLHVKPKIKEFADFFKGMDSDAKFQYRLAEWYFQHSRFANGFICLTEAIVTQIAYQYKKLGTKINYKSYEQRKKIEKILLEKRMRFHPDPDFQVAGNLFYEIKKIRNNAAHAGYFHNLDYNLILEKTRDYLKQTRHYFFNKSMEKKLLAFLEENPFEELTNQYFLRN